MPGWGPGNRISRIGNEAGAGIENDFGGGGVLSIGPTGWEAGGPMNGQPKKL